MGTSPTERLAEHFAEGQSIFVTSPLYRSLCRTVAQDRPLLELLTQRRAGQQASYLFFGAVHYLLLGVDLHPLAGHQGGLPGPGVVPQEPRDQARGLFLVAPPPLRGMTRDPDAGLTARHPVAG